MHLRVNISHCITVYLKKSRWQLVLHFVAFTVSFTGCGGYFLLYTFSSACKRFALTFGGCAARSAIHRSVFRSSSSSPQTIPSHLHHPSHFHRVNKQITAFRNIFVGPQFFRRQRRQPVAMATTVVVRARRSSSPSTPPSVLPAIPPSDAHSPGHVDSERRACDYPVTVTRVGTLEASQARQPRAKRRPSSHQPTHERRARTHIRT